MVITGGYLWDVANSLFDAPAAARGGVAQTRAQAAALDIWESEDGAEARLALPGVRAEALEITVQGDTVAVRTQAASAELPEGARWLHREGTGGAALSRSFVLPFEIAQEEVVAALADGMLTLRLPRAASSRPRRISLAAPATPPAVAA